MTASALQPSHRAIRFSSVFVLCQTVKGGRHCYEGDEEHQNALPQWLQKKESNFYWMRRRLLIKMETTLTNNKAFRNVTVEICEMFAHQICKQNDTRNWRHYIDLTVSIWRRWRFKTSKCYAVSTGKQLPTFIRTVALSSSESFLNAWSWRRRHCDNSKRWLTN